MRIADFELSNHVRLLRENSKLILIVSLASCVVSFLGTGLLMDDSYWSEAEIRVLDGVSSPTGSQNPVRSVGLVRERMTQNSLEKIIVDNSLYQQERRGGSLDRAVTAIERDISISVVRDDVVRLAFRAGDPDLAQRVTSQLVSQYDDGVNQVPTQEERIRPGLSDEIKRAEADLASQEERVKDFNLRFLGGHLEKQTATLATLNRLILQLQSNADLLNALQEQKSSQERLLPQQERQGSSEPAGGPADSKGQVALQPADSSSQSNPSSLTFSEVQSKLDQFNSEIEQRKRQQTEIRKEMALYQARIDSAPKIRALQSAIVRDYENARRRYQELLAKKNQSEMAKAGESISGPRFQVLVPASLPDAPSNGQSRFLAGLSGLVWGPLVGMGFVVLRSQRMERSLTLEQVVSQSGLTVLASIPWISLEGVRTNSQLSERDSRQSSSQTT